MELFERQARECAPYGEYMNLVGVRPESVRASRDIPFLPIELFKTHRVYCGAAEPELIFASSGTGGAGSSRHHVARADEYESTFRRGFERVYGTDYSLFALLPGYRPESSLVHMARGLGARFFLGDDEGLLEALRQDGHRRKIVLGVSHALLDLAENHASTLPVGTIVMETGGMKGRRRELSKEELHRLLGEAFGVPVHSEYGMAELSSQAYSTGAGSDSGADSHAATDSGVGSGLAFSPPPWMRVVARDVNDPFTLLPAGRRGGLNIIDLANQHSCAFIQTQDVGVVTPDGSFRVEGRIDRSEIRGCNLMVNG